MESPLRKKMNSIMKDHKKRQVWYRVVTTLAVVVVFITTYMLILPAITMENKAQCGITEHKHDANCYSTHYETKKVLACTTESLGVHKHTDACYDAQHKLICGYADFVIHQHDASCYDENGTLVCAIPEHKLHQHTENCYQMQKQLICTQEESVGHTHTAECYTKEKGDLICTKEEHTHDENCYDAEGNLICGKEEHVHGDECYQWNDVLTCTIPESAGHQHSDACYQDVKVLVCEEPAELHTHTAECYKDGVLACGKMELKEHKHDDTCYKEEQVLVETLVCDRVEHVHTDECYKKSASSEVEIESSEEVSSEEVSSEIVSSEAKSEEASSEAVSEEAESGEVVSEEVSSENPEEISSEEASTEEVSSEMVSTEESSEELTSEEASSEEESTEEISSEEASTEGIDDLMLDEKYDYPVALISSNAVKMDKTNTYSLTLSGGDKDNQTKYDPDKNLYYTRIKLGFDFKTSEIKKGLEYYFEYPDGIIIPEGLLSDKKDLNDSNGHKVGTYHFEKDANGKYRVIINFDESYVEGAGDKITGFVDFNGSVDGSKGDQKGNIEIKGSDGVDLIIPKDQITYPDDKTNAYDISVTKKGSYEVKDGKLVYTVEVASIKGTPNDIQFEDILKVTGMQIGNPNIKVEKVTTVRHYYDWDNQKHNYDSDEATKTISVSSTYDNGKISMTLPKLNGLENPDEDHKTKEYVKYRVTYTYDVSNMQDANHAGNTVSVSSKDNTTEVKSTAKSEFGINNDHTINKSGWFDKQNGKIKWTIDVNSNHVDIAGSKLTDDMLAYLAEGTDVSIQPENGCEVIKDKTNGKITGITFKATDGERNTNSYKIIYYTPAEGAWKDETVINHAKFTPGDGKETIEKTETVTVSDGSIAKTVGSVAPSEDGKTVVIPWKVTLIIPKSGLPSGTVITDDPTEGANHYMTYDQICSWKDDIYWTDENDQRIGSGNLDLTSLADIQFKASDGNTYAYKDIIANENKFKNVTFTIWNVTLQKDLSLPVGAKKLIFEYSTTADISNANIGSTYYKNTIKSNNKNVSAQYEYKKGGLIKTDGENNTGITSKENEDGTLIWKIKAILESESSILNITDELPKGVKLVSIKGEDWANNFGNLTITEKGIISGAADNSLKLDGKYEDNKVSLTLKTQYENQKLQAGATYTFVLTCKVDTNELQDYESGKTYTFTNHATASDDHGSIGSTEQTQEWTEKKNIQEIKVIDKSGSWDNHSRRVKYQIKLNPDGKDIVASSDVLTLKDEFKYYKRVHAQPQGKDWNDGKDFDVNAWLLPDTVKLYKATKQEDGTLVKGDLITTWSWTVTTGEVSWDANYGLSTITSDNIPDSTPLILEYDYQIQTDIPSSWESSGNINISNSARLEGTTYKDDESQNDTKWTVQDSSAGVTTERRYTIYKVSKGDYGKVLQGAEFKLQKYNGSEYEDTDKIYTTDKDGMITVKWQKEENDYQYETNTLYRLIEAKAPDGYALPSPMQIEKNAVYFYFSSKTDTTNKLPESLPKGAWDLAKTSQVAYVENEEENAQITVQKKWMYTTKDGDEKYVAAWENQIDVALYRKESTKDPADETKETATLIKKEHSWSNPVTEEFPFGTVISLTLKSEGGEWYVPSLPEVKWNGQTATPKEDIPASASNKWTHIRKYEFVLTEMENTLEEYGESGVFDIQQPTPKEDTLIGMYTLNAANNWRVSVSELPRAGVNNDGEKVYYTYYIKELTSKEGVSVTYDNNNGITSGTITVTNKKPEPEGGEYVLPETGGTGTYWYTLGGLLLIAGAALLMYINFVRKGGKRIR